MYALTRKRKAGVKSRIGLPGRSSTQLELQKLLGRNQVSLGLAWLAKAGERE
jgi:hypothetical protein